MSDFFSYGGPVAVAPVAGGGDAPPRAILADLSGDDWEQFIAFAARRRYPPGGVIVAAGDAAQALCFIASGQVTLHGPDRTPHGMRGEGQLVGLLSFLDGAASSVTATVTGAGPAEVLLLSPEALQQLSAWQPRIALALMRDLGAHVAARLRQLHAGD